MTPEPWLPLEAVLMTTHPIAAYGGLRFPRDTLERAADSITAHGLPMHVDHDLSQPLRYRNLHAWVDDGADGYARLKLKYEIHTDDAHYLDTRMAMSTTITSPLAGREQLGAANPVIELSADHAWFSDEALIQAESMITSQGLSTDSIRTERAYQFSFIPDPQIFVTLVDPAVILLQGVAATALWDAIKALYRKRQTPPNGDEQTPTRLNTRIETGDRSITFHVETLNFDTACEAIDAIEDIALSFLTEQPKGSPPESTGEKQILLWDADARAWLPRATKPARVSPPPGHTGE